MAPTSRGFPRLLRILGVALLDAAAGLRGAAGGPPGWLPLLLNASRKQQRVHLIRIQKTGGTTFGERIMKHFCGKDTKDCRWFWHLDWVQATKEGQDLRLVALLREPVERTLSEFFYIRSPEGQEYARQSQWDFRNSTWLDLVQKTPSVDAALEIFLHGYRGSPSRNRQALYLIGFKPKRWAPDTRDPYNWEPLDWDARHGELLAQAKQHLDQTTAFGLTDCYAASVGVIARRLGWDEHQAVELASSYHENRQNRISMVSLMSPGRVRYASLPQQELVGLGTAAEVGEPWWRHLVREDVVREVERLNALDMELHAFALQRFRERFGLNCTPSSGRLVGL